MASPSSRFATLTPDNPLAQKYLAALVSRQLLDPDQVVTLAAPRNAAGRAPAPRYQLILSFERLDITENNGWRVGKLVPGVNLPVCQSRSRCIKEDIFCEITIHPQSGALMLQNWSQDNPIIYLCGDGHTNVKLQFKEEHILHMPINYLRIGSLHFVLEFCVEDESIYAAYRYQHMLRRYQDWNPPPLLDLLPKPSQVLKNNLVYHRTIGHGAFGLVDITVDRQSGRVLACKTVQGNKPKELAVMENEVNIARSIPAGAAGILPLLRSWCDHNPSQPCFQTNAERMHLLMPYAPFTFRSAPWRDMVIATRLALFRQVLQGARNLHAMGIMHRDISPANLLVFWPRVSPPSAVICDFGKAKRGATGSSTSLGPPAFTAPEVGIQAEYTSAIDIFSLGLCFLMTFEEPEDQWRWGSMSRENHAAVLERLKTAQRRMPERLAALILSMLAWDPAARPTAQEALADEVWEQADEVKEQADEAPSGLTRTSSDGGGGGAGGDQSPGATRLRRSDGPPPSSSGSGSRLTKRTRRSDAPSPSGSSEVAVVGSGSARPGGRVKRMKRSSSQSLPSPPPE